MFTRHGELISTWTVKTLIRHGILKALEYSRKRTRQHHRVAFRVSEPILPVPVFAELTRPDNVDIHRLGSRDSGVKIFQFKPQDHSVAIRLQGLVTKRTMMMLNLPLVKLQDKAIAIIESLVLRATMPACDAQKFLVPPATRFDIPNTD